MLDHPFKEAIAVLEKIERYGYEAYFVGGCVRDYLLGNSIRDIDIATSATPQTIQKIFEKVIPVGIEHGTVIVRHQQISYEVTTFRIDGTYSDNRHPDQVAFVSKIEKDLERRDFTINAMAMDKQGTIIDIFHGRDDIDKRTIRTVGNGFDRFTEDPLRIVRALRFASQLGFTLDRETKEQIKILGKEVNTVAVERLSVEMEKFFAGKHVAHALKEMQTTELYKNLPVLKNKPDIIRCLTRKQKPLHTLPEIFAFFHLLDPSVSIMVWIKEWKASNQTKRNTLKLVEAVKEYRRSGLQNWLIYQLPTELYDGFIRVLASLFEKNIPSRQEMDNLHSKLPIMSRKQLQLNGNDLSGFFPTLPKGPWMQKLLLQVEFLVVMKEIPNDKEHIKEWLKWNPPEIN